MDDFYFGLIICQQTLRVRLYQIRRCCLVNLVLLLIMICCSLCRKGMNGVRELRWYDGMLRSLSKPCELKETWKASRQKRKKMF